MPDKDQLPSRGIPFRALVDANGVAVNGTATITQLRQRGMQPVCQVDSSGVHSGGSTQAQLRSRGIPVFCEVNDSGADPVSGATLAQLRSRGIPAACMLDENGAGGSSTMAQLRQRGIPYFCPLDENGDATTLSGGGFSSEAQQFFDRIADPGTTRKNLYAAMIDGIVLDGVWTKLDALYIWAADIQANALINLKSSSFPCVTAGTVSFAADNGFTGNASDFVLNTGMNPSTAGGNYTQDSASIGVYVLNSRAATANKHNVGAANAAFTQNSNINVFDSGGSIVQIRVNATTATTSAAPGSSQGSWGVSRTGAAAGSLCRNGAQVTTFVVASVGMPDRAFMFFAFHLSSGAFGHVADQMSAGFIGGGLTSTELNNLSNRINTYMTGLPVPINVY